MTDGYDIGVFQGTSTLLLGAAGGDLDPSTGVKVTLHAGDVLVLPAGTAHSSVDADNSPEYRYVGVYPEVRILHSMLGWC